MPIVGDILQMTAITDLKGVAMRNNTYQELISLGSTATLADIGLIWSQEYVDVFDGVMTNEVNFIAFLVDNLTRNEVRGVVTSTATGSITGGAHPQDQVLRFNEYAPDTAVNEMRRGAFNLSGVAETLSTDGRLNNVATMSAAESFLGQQFLDSPSGLTLNPQVRRRIPASSPPQYTFHRIERVQVNPTYFKLKSRKTTILGA